MLELDLRNQQTVLMLENALIHYMEYPYHEYAKRSTLTDPPEEQMSQCARRIRIELECEVDTALGGDPENDDFVFNFREEQYVRISIAALAAKAANHHMMGTKYPAVNATNEIIEAQNCDELRRRLEQLLSSDAANTMKEG